MALGKKTGGRQKGTPNKITNVTREVIADLTAAMLPDVIEKLKKLEPKDYVHFWLKLNEFNLPKPQSVDMNITANKPKTIEDTLEALAEENDE